MRLTLSLTNYSCQLWHSVERFWLACLCPCLSLCLCPCLCFCIRSGGILVVLSGKESPLNGPCVLCSNQSAVFVFDLSHQSRLFMAACHRNSFFLPIQASQDGPRSGAGAVAVVVGLSQEQEEKLSKARHCRWLPTADCRLPVPCPV